jgi:hypothetical protein
LAPRSGNRGALGLLAPHGSWERNAPWVAPLLIAGLLALATFFMFASSGAALI